MSEDYDRDMPPGGDVCPDDDMPMSKTEGGFGASVNDIARGFTQLDAVETPAENVDYPSVMGGDTASMPNPQRMAYDPSTGKMFDKYRGGFLPRDPRHPNER